MCQAPLFEYLICFVNFNFMYAYLAKILSQSVGFLFSHVNASLVEQEHFCFMMSHLLIINLKFVQMES